jgi:uncharacterized protein YcfL
MLVLLVLLVLVSACSHPRAVLVNDRGQEVLCEADGVGLLFSMMANNTYKNCVEAAQEKGYKIKESK